MQSDLKFVKIRAGMQFWVYFSSSSVIFSFRLDICDLERIKTVNKDPKNHLPVFLRFRCVMVLEVKIWEKLDFSNPWPTFLISGHVYFCWVLLIFEIHIRYPIAVIVFSNLFVYLWFIVVSVASQTILFCRVVFSELGIEDNNFESIFRM